MNRYELQLNPQTILSYILKRILKNKLDEFCANKMRLKIKLAKEHRAFSMEMELRPRFYKFRPIDIQYQIRHNKFKLSPISTNTQSSDQYLKIQKACIYSKLVLRRLQDTACQYRSSINNKFLTVEFIKNREQNTLTANYKLRLRPTPYKNKDLL